MSARCLSFRAILDRKTICHVFSKLFYCHDLFAFRYSVGIVNAGLLNEHLLFRHWLFIELREQMSRAGRSILMPNLSSTNSMAARMALYESRLQQRGPPVSAILARAREVIKLLNPHVSPARGLLLVTMLMNIPVLIPAPQAPQFPQALHLCTPRRYGLLGQRVILIPA